MMPDSRSQLLAGVAKVDITTSDLMGLTNLWRPPVEGIHNPIYLRALVLDNGRNAAATAIVHGQVDMRGRY